MENGRQFIPLSGVADLDAGAILGTSSGPLLRAPLEAILSDTPAPTPLPYGARAQQLTVLGPATDPSTGEDQLLPPPHCLDPFVHHLPDETVLSCDESEAPLAQPT